MKHFATVLCMAFAATAFASTRVEVSALPSGEYADTEVSTNVALTVNAERLERLTVAVSLDPCVTNEVIAAIGADTDNDGDLSLDETGILFGCDCGTWCRADLRTGDVEDCSTNTLVIGKREFDPAWNLAKVVRRGFGEIDGSVSVDEERVRFNIRIR